MKCATENKRYLFIYAYTDFLNGLIVGTAGPLIPFLAANAHIKATSYYFVFISRSVGAVLGAIFYKILQHYGRASYHHIFLGISSIVFALSLLSFQFWESLVGVGVLFGIFVGLNYCQNIALSCCLLMVPAREDIFFWLSMSNGSFGIGSLLAPIVVDVFTTNAYTVEALLLLPIIPIYLCYFQSPQQKRE